MSEGTRPITPSIIEIRRLLAIADRDLQQAQFDNLHLDTRFSLAYNAVLQLATVILRLHGVRVRKPAFHRQTFVELAKQLGLHQQEMVASFERARRKRNIVAYEQPGAVSASELADLVAQAGEFRSWVQQELDKRMRTRDGPVSDAMA
jgi:uncharacterized protein (UPF0332 family)